MTLETGIGMAPSMQQAAEPVALLRAQRFLPAAALLRAQRFLPAAALPRALDKARLCEAIQASQSTQMAAWKAIASGLARDLVTMTSWTRPTALTPPVAARRTA